LDEEVIESISNKIMHIVDRKLATGIELAERDNAALRCLRDFVKTRSLGPLSKFVFLDNINVKNYLCFCNGSSDSCNRFFWMKKDCDRYLCNNCGTKHRSVDRKKKRAEVTAKLSLEVQQHRCRFTAYKHKPMESIFQRLHEQSEIIISLRRRNSRCEENIKKLLKTNYNNEIGSNSLNDLQAMLTKILEKGGVQETLRGIMAHQFKLASHGKTDEQKNNLWENSAGRRQALIEGVEENFRNFSLDFAAKKTQLRFSPVMLQLAMLLYMKSPTTYEAFCKSNSVLKLPSGSTMAKYKATKKHSSGCSCEIYSNAATRYCKRYPDSNDRNDSNAGGLPLIDGMLMVDEVKLHCGVAFHSITHEMIGFTEELWDFGDLGAAMFEEDEGKESKEVEMPRNLVTHANVWKYRLVI
jgi:hypothetical protein